MYTFISRQNRTLIMDLEGGGISFRYNTGKGVYHSGQSWAGIHALLAKLYRSQTYSTRTQSLSAWIQDQELCLRFRARGWKLEEVCKFSPEETLKIMDFLGKAPNLN